MQAKFQCKCGATFAPQDLSGNPRTHCPICRTQLPITAQVVKNPAPPASPPKSPPPVSPPALSTSPARAEYPTAPSIPRAKRPYQKTALLVFAIVCFLLAAGMAVMGVRDYRQGQESKSWPNVSGSILASGIRQHTGVGRRFRPIEGFMVDIQYSYLVDGQTWYGDKVTLADLPMKQEEAQAMATRFRVGGTYPVYYDPADPSRAALMPGYEGMARFHLALGVAAPAGLFLIGLLLLGAMFNIPNSAFK